MKHIIKNIVFILLIISTVYLFDNYEKIREYKTEIEKKEIILNNQLEIYYLDVGEADCTLIRNNHKNILIDAGNNKDGEKIVAFLKELGITNFEYVITTHSHEDHIGGMDNIIRNFEINHFYIPNVELNTTSYHEVIDLLNEKKIQIETPPIDEIFKVEDMIFQILWINDNKESINLNSIILKLEYGNNSFLFTADAPKEAELQILEKNIKSDVLKVGHHGSAYSTSAQFLKKVYPTYAIISVGNNNDYGFPKQITLDKLKRINAKIYRTDLDGTIYLTSNGNEINIKTMKTDTNKE